MRIILFTGKGGTGKTTIAAATALKLAAAGKKTLVISTDPAHSLADSLNAKLGPEPVNIVENLWAQELDVYYSMRKHWGNIRELMRSLFRWQGMDAVLSEELSAIPGMEEGAAFLWIEQYYSKKQFDVIVIDSAPTGETLTLLTLPQVTKWWVTKTMPFQKLAIKTIGKGIRKATGVPLDKGYEELENIFDKLEKIQKVFSNQNICSIRIVCNPERMVINESKRAYTYLQLYGYNVDAVIVNRILPDSADSGFMQNYFESQKEYLKQIDDTFKPLPVFKLYHTGKEVFGKDDLQEIGTQIYGEQSPATIFYKDVLFTITEIKNGYEVKIKIPLLDVDSLKVNKTGDELTIETGTRRKNLFLPRFTNFLTLSGFSYSDSILTVKLEKKQND